MSYQPKVIWLIDQSPLILKRNKGDMYTSLHVLGLSCGLVVLLFFLCSVVIGYQVKALKHRFAPQLAPNDQFELDPSRTVQEQAKELPYNLIWEFPRNHLSLQKVIGSGNFGHVWEALAEGIRTFKFVSEDKDSPAVATPALVPIHKDSDSTSDVSSSNNDNGNDDNNGNNGNDDNKDNNGNDDSRANNGNNVDNTNEGNNGIDGNNGNVMGEPDKETGRTEDVTSVKKRSRFTGRCWNIFCKYFREEKPEISFTYASKVAVKCLKD